MKTPINGKKLALLLSFLYFTSYVTRVNFAAVIQEVITDTGFAKSTLSAVLVCLSVSYGIGQIINGRIGDRIKPQDLILMGLCTAALSNAVFPLAKASIPAMCVIWTVNGFAQAMMWPPMVKIMVSMMDEATYGASVIMVSIGSSVGNIFVYLTAPVIISFLSWRAVMFISAALGLIGAVIWLILKNRCYDEERLTAQKIDTPSEPSKKFTMPRSAIFPFMLIAAAIILQGMIRDGVTSWMPTYLSENFGMENGKSILLTVSLAVMSMLSFVVAGAFYKKFFKSEVACASALYAFAAACALLLLILFNVGGAVVAVVLMALITGAIHGVNLMLISHVPKRFKKHGNISTVSGLVNSFTYIGAAVVTYGVAKLSELFGWRTTVGVWLGVLLIGTLLTVIAVPRWRKFTEE